MTGCVHREGDSLVSYILDGNLRNLVRIEVGGLDLSSHSDWASGPMVTRSEAGGHLPPVLGALSAAVTTKRLDLVSLRGHIVRVPRTLDVDIVEEGAPGSGCMSLGWT